MNLEYVKKQGPLVFNVMRKIAMALFKQDNTKSASMARKKKMAGLDDDYRSTLLVPLDLNKHIHFPCLFHFKTMS